MIIELGEPINTAEVIGERDAVYFAAQARRDALDDVDYSVYNNNPLRQIEEMKRDQAERQALKAAQSKTPYGVLQAILDIRSRAYEARYGKGSYPPRYDQDDEYSETLTFPVRVNKKLRASLRVTFSPKGVERKLRCESHGVSAQKLLSYLMPSPLMMSTCRSSPMTSSQIHASSLASEWDKGMKPGTAARTGKAEMNRLQLLSLARNMSYAEIGSMALEPLDELKHKGIGTEMAKQLFERVMRDGGINKEQFLIAEATPASATPLLKAAIAAKIPCLVRMDTATVRATGDGSLVPRVIIVFSHDRDFINTMEGETPFVSLRPEIYLTNINTIEDYLRAKTEDRYWAGDHYRAFKILKIDKNNPYLWLPWLKKPESPSKKAGKPGYSLRLA